MKKPLTQKQLVLIGGMFAVMGMVIVLIGTGAIDTKRNAPGWVIVALTSVVKKRRDQ